MGAISDIVDIVKLTKDISKDKVDVNTAAKLFGKAKSISSMASKYIIEYPVAVTSRITNVKTAIAIAKQVEIECARFIILTSGLDPVINNGRIEDKIDQLMTSNESNKYIKWNLRPATDKDFENGQIFMSEHYSNEEYKFPKLKRSRFSLEADTIEVLDENGKLVTEETTTEEPAENNSNNNENSTHGQNNRKDSTYYTIYNKDITSNAMKTLNKIGPTIVNIRLTIQNSGGGFQTIDVPLAIKASLQFLDSDDIVQIIENTHSNKNMLFNFIKLTTGQISFFKDYLFQLENAKNDMRREYELGRYPFYRRLIDAKNRNKFKRITDMIPVLKNFITKTNRKDMPMCTIVVTIDEITSATKTHLNYILKHRNSITDIIDTYMLLCFGIIDELNEIIYFFFSGIDEPYICDIKKLGSSTGGADKVMEELSKLLIQTTKYSLTK